MNTSYRQSQENPTRSECEAYSNALRADAVIQQNPLPECFVPSAMPQIQAHLGLRQATIGKVSRPRANSNYSNSSNRSGNRRFGPDLHKQRTSRTLRRFTVPNPRPPPPPSSEITNGHRFTRRLICAAESTTIRAAPRLPKCRDFYVGNVDPDVTKEEFLAFLSSKSVDVVLCEELNVGSESSRAYRIKVHKDPFDDTIWDSKFWPGINVRRSMFPRKTRPNGRE